MSFTAVIGAHARGSCVEGARDLFLDKLFRVKMIIHAVSLVFQVYMVNKCK